MAATQTQTQPEPQTQAEDTDRPTPEAEAASTPIIVEGSTEAREVRAQTGSRIPGEPLYRDLNVATSTGIAGLTPGSGMQPFSGANAVTKRITTTCVSDNDAVGERASCLLLEAQEARAENDLAGAIDIYRFLVSSQQFGREERLTGGTELYNLAGEIGDTVLREEALIRLVDGDVLNEIRRRPAMLTLSDMARARGDNDLALKRLNDYRATGVTGPDIYSNIAILMRTTGRPGAEDMMQQAIDTAPDWDMPVPQGWLDFVRLGPNAPQMSAQEIGGDTSQQGELAEPGEQAEPEFATTTVLLETSMGTITIALETQRAPITAGNFLRYVDEGRFDGIVFYRAMHLDWGDQPNGLLQGGAQWDPDRVLPGIPHEPTTTTGLSHTRGALSMAMGEPGTANGDFSIMLGDQTGLDANPASEDPVWQNGYAVFGYVTDGMDVVEAIHAAPLDPQKGEGWMKGQMLADPVTVVDARRLEPIAE